KKIFTQVPRLRDARHFPSREIKDERLLFCGGVSFFPTVSGTIFFYQKSFLIESFHQNVAAIQKMTICAFHRAWLRRYSNVTGVLKTLQEGVGIECLAIVVTCQKCA
ncbi:hypothetical protein, partial [Salmonella enterica]|uniref:hypothetical protein n=4 Tax=Salmonella enterica TaxID=28901 RepID=UPI001C38316A